MRILKFVLFVSLGLLLHSFLSYDTPYLIGAVQKEELQPDNLLKNLNNPSKKLPFLRIMDDENKEYTMCSGFVVSKSIAVTAAHCLSFSKSDFFSLERKPRPVYFSSDDFSVSGVADVISFSLSNDIAFIKGDFSSFNSLRLDLYGEYFPNFPLTNSAITVRSCGYPFGGVLKCIYSYYSGPVANKMSMYGSSIFKGMSGGPIMIVMSSNDPLDVSRDLVIAVNASISISNINFFGSPTFSMLQFLSVK